MKALRQYQLQMILLSVLSATIVFNGTPLAVLASGWFDASDRPDWITGGTLFWLDDGESPAPAPRQVSHLI